MRYHALRDQLKDFNFFSLSDIRKIDSRFYSARLSEWQKNGYVKKLRRGYYMFADTRLTEESLFFIANHLYVPSYVSFESALSYHGLIPEGVYSITSACGRKTARFATPIAEFSYRHLKPVLLFGYELLEHEGKGYKIADIEKTVLDYLYLHPSIEKEADFQEWRFDSETFFAKVDLAKLHNYAKAFESKALLVRLETLLARMRVTPS